MRRLLISIIAISLFYQVFGYLLVFNANELLCKKEIKARIKSGLRKSEKDYFIFSESDFKNLDWKNEKEFEHNGNMYDIIEKSVEGDSVHIACINDKKETALFANLSDHIDRNSDLTTTGKPISKVLLKLLKIEGLLIKDENCALFMVIENPYIKHNSQKTKDYANVCTPPPELFGSKL